MFFGILKQQFGSFTNPTLMLLLIRVYYSKCLFPFNGFFNSINSLSLSLSLSLSFLKPHHLCGLFCIEIGIGLFADHVGCDVEIGVWRQRGSGRYRLEVLRLVSVVGSWVLVRWYVVRAWVADCGAIVVAWVMQWWHHWHGSCDWFISAGWIMKLDIKIHNLVF